MNIEILIIEWLLDEYFKINNTFWYFLVENRESVISLLPDSPHSTDSGMADSPDGSMLGSPYFEVNDFPESDSHLSSQHENIYTPTSLNLVTSVENGKFNALVLDALPPVNNNSPAKITDAQSIQNLLELLSSNKSTSGHMLKLLSTLLSNSLKKDLTEKPQIPCPRKVLPHPIGRKRQGCPSSSEISAKEPRLEMTKQTKVSPAIVITEQPEQV